jgi:hypothetical protein
VFVVKFFDGVVPAPSEQGTQAVAELGSAVSAKLQDYIAAMEKVRGWLWPGCGSAALPCQLAHLCWRGHFLQALELSVHGSFSICSAGLITRIMTALS